MVWEIESVESNTTLIINGDEREVTVGDDLKNVVLEAAREAGYSKFKLFIDEEEVLPQDAPQLIEAGKTYKIVAFDVAG
jgi:hypothetical protein